MVNDMTQLPNGTKTKHIVIQLPGEAISRVVIDKNSLLWLAYSLKREYVWLHGYLDDYVSIHSLSSDLLMDHVLYRLFLKVVVIEDGVSNVHYIVFSTIGNK